MAHAHSYLVLSEDLKTEYLRDTISIWKSLSNFDKNEKPRIKKFEDKFVFWVVSYIKKG